MQTQAKEVPKVKAGDYIEIQLGAYPPTSVRGKPFSARVLKVEPREGPGFVGAFACGDLVSYQRVDNNMKGSCDISFVARVLAGKEAMSADLADVAWADMDALAEMQDDLDHGEPTAGCPHYYAENY